jgi:hypothetical protein
MSQQAFQTVRKLQESGAPLPLILANPAWQGLLDKIESNLAERSAILNDAMSKLPQARRRALVLADQDYELNMAKRARLGEDELTTRRQALLSKIETIQSANHDSFDAYRQQVWQQYEAQEQAGGHVAPAAPVATSDEPPSPDEDEEIHNALLGLT